MTSFKSTYLGKVKSKSFIIITLLLVSLVIVAFNSENILKLFEVNKNIGIVTENENVYKEISSNKNTYYENIDMEKYSKREAEKYLESEEIDYFIEIDISANDEINAELFSKSEIPTMISSGTKNLLDNLQSQISIQKLGLKSDEIKELNTQSTLNEKILNDRGEISDKEKNFQLLFFAFVIVATFFIVMTYTNQIAMEVAVEKTSRVIEMILTSIKPSLHILAKIVGIFMVALTQVMILILTVCFCLLIFDAGDILEKFDLEVTSHSIFLITVSIVFWLIGILSYTIIAAVLGSLTSRIEDIGQSVMPPLMILLASFYIVLFSYDNTDNYIVKVSSYIPLFSPFTMLFRIANNEVDILSVILSIVISIIFIVIAFIIASKSYKSSILSYEKNIFYNLRDVILRRNV